MKVLFSVVWVCWAAIIGRILLAPAFGLTLSEGLFLMLVCAPAVGLLSCLRWVFFASKGADEAEPPRQPPPPAPPSPAPETHPAPKPRPDHGVKPVQVLVF